MQGYDHFFPLTIHREHLASLQGVNFTPREIDILCCLVHVRGGRKISSLLSISPNTVLSHIRHIMLKLDCNSREGIIDFIEQSKDLSKIKERYTYLVLHSKFLKHLKSIKRENAKEGKASKPILLVFHGGNQKHQKVLQIHLNNHLKQAGLKVDIGSINTKERPLSIKIYTYRLLLYLDDHTKNAISKKFCDFERVNLIEYQNYYFLFLQS